MNKDCKYYKLSNKVSRKQFYEIVEIELNSGFIPYTESMIAECILYMDNFVCSYNDEIIGFITVEPFDELYDESNYIVNISVYPDYRGNNIAKKLIRFACNYYLENKLIKNKQITLDVELNNKALKLYELIGFERLNVPSRNGKDNIVMGQDAKVIVDKIDEILENK